VVTQVSKKLVVLHWRHMHSRLARNFLASVCIVAALVWWV
jgi:hypothetical protein